MKIHFIGSLSGNKQNYKMIIKILEELGHKIITYNSIEKSIAEIKNDPPDKSKGYVESMLKWIKNAEIVVAEVSDPDLGTGYELAIAQAHNKPIIVLYTEDKDINVLVGYGEINEYMQVIEYDSRNIRSVLATAIDDAHNLIDVRFNFFVSPRIVNYLDWIAKQRKMPRAVYLRRLIEKDMEKNKDFEKEE